MPGEQEIINSVSNTQGNNNSSAFDVTQFAENNEEVSNVVITTITLDSGSSLDIEVPKRALNDLGELNPELLNQEDMLKIIDSYSVCYIDVHDCWMSGALRDFDYCNYDAYWMPSDETVLGINPDGDEDYFSYNESYVRCYDTDTIYYDSDTASNNGCYYCEHCDEYRSEEHDFDDCGDDECDDRFFNNTVYPGTCKTLDMKKRWGTCSPTYSISNGMKHTFGVEIETERGSLSDICEFNLKGVYDGSTSGVEYVTGVLKGDYGFNHLKGICNRISEDHEINQRCGVHVHIGGNFNRVFTIMLLRLGYKIQDEVFRMMPPSRIGNSFCKFIPTWAGVDINFQNWRNEIGRYIYAEDAKLDRFRNKKCRHDQYASTRYRWININNFSTASGKPTIEFRCHGASMNYEKIRNWVLICMAIVSYAENNQRKVWYNIEDVTLKDVIMQSLGDNIGKQVYDYYKQRVELFKEPIKNSGKKLPSELGVIE